MPFDAIQSRPFMRHGTAELAVLVDSGAADLRAILAELSHRERGAARKLASRVASMLQDGPAPVVMPPAEVVPCIHGEVAPEAREVVVSVERVTVTNAPAKPARKAKGEKRPGDVGWRPLSFGARIAKAGNAAYMWPAPMNGVNALLACRLAGLAQLGREIEGAPAGYRDFVLPNRGLYRISLTSAGLYDGDQWRQWSREERDEITEAGRPFIAAEIARLEREERQRQARQSCSVARRHALDYCANWRAKRGTPLARFYPADGRKSALVTAWAKRREIRAKAAV